MYVYNSSSRTLTKYIHVHPFLTHTSLTPLTHSHSPCTYMYMYIPSSLTVTTYTPHSLTLTMYAPSSSSLLWWYRDTRWVAKCRSYSSLWGSSIRKIRSNRLNRVCGSCIFSTTVARSSQRDIRGLAAARMEVRALREQIMPALAMERVCCSCSGNQSQPQAHMTERDQWTHHIQ